MTPARRAATKEEKGVSHKERKGHVEARFIAPSVIRRRMFNRKVRKAEGSTKFNNVDIRNLRALRASAVKSPNPFSSRSCGSSRVGCEKLVDGLVKFLGLLRHREVTGIAQLQVLRAGYGPMDLHFILRR
jgi:hypothetical protein